MTSEIVPFGKYRGQPVEVLAADHDYCEWLTAQPWFKARYLNVYNTVINYGTEPQDSPEHNQMQGRMFTYVDPKKIRSTNPGYCYLMAGWHKHGHSKNGKLLLVKYDGCPGGETRG